MVNPTSKSQTTPPTFGRILIVDDERMNRVVLDGMLKRNGYQTAQAEHGAEALDLVAQGGIELVLLDIVMPDIDGFDVLTRLREQHTTAELPVIMVTGDNDRAQVIKAFQQGANDYVTKPLDVDLAMARIETQMQLRKSQAALRASEERYALAAGGTNDGLWDWQITTGEAYFSPRWKTMLGLDDQQEMDSIEDWLDRIHADDQQSVECELQSHLKGELPHFEAELRMRRDDDSYRWMLCRGMAIRDKDGVATRMAGSLTDITEGKVADALTGLPNRLLFRDRLQRTIDRYARSPRDSFAVLYLDLDNFKLINDSLGHEAGDQLLIGVARRLEGCLRACESIVARFGGDEFTILLERLDSADEAELVAKRVIDAITAPFTLGNGREIFAAASIGISHVRQQQTKIDDMLREADTAMYEAKSSGKSQYRVFEPTMQQQATERLDIESELRRALDRDEISLHYQPIVEVESGALVGFEALSRWSHPRMGMVMPSQFIPIAEETGLIVPIGQAVLEMACRQLSEWKSRYDACESWNVSVNISSKQLKQKGLVELIQQTLDRENLLPGDLRLEVTESAIMEEPEQGVDLLTSLRELGVRVGIDDFGTGYSSLAALHSLPLDVLKIDRSFVDKMSHSRENIAIIRTILALANHMNLDVVAEGIETEEQREKLLSMGCKFGQGFHFSRPLDNIQFEALLAEPVSKESLVCV